MAIRVFAQTDARRRGEERLVSIMSNEPVFVAGKRLASINTRRRQLAVDPALPSNDGSRFVRIMGIKYLGKRDVYNMEVQDHHNFSVNGGLIIHNCSDAERYGLYTNRNKLAMSVY